MKKRMYELAKTRRCLKKEKAHKRCVYGLSGVPGSTRTPGLPLRSLAFLLVRYTHHNFPLFLIRYGIVWLLVNLHKNP